MSCGLCFPKFVDSSPSLHDIAPGMYLLQCDIKCHERLDPFRSPCNSTFYQPPFDTRIVEDTPLGIIRGLNISRDAHKGKIMASGGCISSAATKHEIIEILRLWVQSSQSTEHLAVTEPLGVVSASAAMSSPSFTAKNYLQVGPHG